MLEPFFLDSAGGRIFCTVHRPPTGAGGGPGVLFLPPFAEEMNKSRHVLAGLGRRLAARGCTTIVPDPIGTGDSDGEFADASWARWRENALDAARWLGRAGCEPLVVGGLRLGASLAVELLGALPRPARSILLWQPIASGRAALTQFLRLRVAATLAGGAAQERVSDLRRRLEAGEAVEIAGYTLGPALYLEIERLDLAAMPPESAVAIDWLEVSLAADGGLLPAARQLAAAWGGVRPPVEPEPVGGPAFWATQELADAPALVERSAERLRARLS